MAASLSPDGGGRGWRPAGEAAWLLEAAGAGLDMGVNARMRATASEVTRLAMAGVRDVVPACASVMVHVDPLRFRSEDVACLPALAHLSVPVPGRWHEVPVVYDGEDLDAVAASTGLAVNEIRRRHADNDYAVLMLGFAPGFPYLGPADSGLVVGRRPTPRVRVAAGAVAVAGGMTCIYPGGTAGGWQILGRTNLTLFRPDDAQPATLASGDRVRFVPVDRLDPAEPAVARDTRGDVSGGIGSGGIGSGSITVLRGGAATTVQDLGRWGFQAMGVPVSGACDCAALRWANRAVGNPDDAAGLEVAAVGPDLRVERETVVACTGADMEAHVDGRPMRAGEPVVAREGAVIRCGQTRGGLRAYVAVAGGLDVPVVLGSRSTCLPGGFGGFAGRVLAAGDRVAIGDAREMTPAGLPLPRALNTDRAGGTFRAGDGRKDGAARAVRLRVLLGPQRDAVSEAQVARLLSETVQVSPQLNRVACRLQREEGMAVTFNEMVPMGTVPGAVQVTPSGDLLLLLADRQTTGGYPQVLIVIGADLGRASQLCPGDTVQFVLCTPGEAIAALVADEARFLGHV
ncbi:MAG: carboxyltransferase domain-containing protein [Vicinamibacterales bacterium]|nr:carboxyltransferase domain-containing protein [Vicinamibacterales bacterium]